jgi:hypothetical protein
MKILTHPTTNGQQPSTSTRWQPGTAIPKDSHPDALEALRRNADAFAKVLTFKKRNAPTFDDPTSGLRRAA